MKRRKEQSEGNGDEKKEIESKVNLERRLAGLSKGLATAVEGEACYFLDEWRCHLPRRRRLE